MSTVLIFGEVLYDCFEDGSRNLGGAPFNVAWHLQGLGMDAQFLSRVGQDEAGQQIQQAMQSWGMDTSLLQTDAEHQTGMVSVRLQQGIPDFDIVENCAYDYIEAADPNICVSAKLLYHGSLALRSETSRHTLLQIRRQVDLPVFIDINLRPPHWDRAVVIQILHKANWVKLNHEELVELSNAESDDLIELAHEFFNTYGLTALIVTQGEKGAFIVSSQGVISQPPVPVEKMNDTVGAGDAFSAMTIFGLLQGWSYDRILNSASAFASRVCGLRGAVTSERAFYDAVLDEIV